MFCLNVVSQTEGIIVDEKNNSVFHSTSSHKIENQILSADLGNGIKIRHISDAIFDNQNGMIVVGSISMTSGDNTNETPVNTRPVGFIGKMNLETNGSVSLNWFHAFSQIRCDDNCNNLSKVQFLEVDSYEAIYVSGYQRGTMLVDNVEVEDPDYVSYSTSTFVMKFSRDGDLIHYNHISDTFSPRIFLDQNDDLWVHGYMQGDGSIGEFSVETEEDYTTVYFAKMDSISGIWDDVKFIQSNSSRYSVTFTPMVETSNTNLIFGYSQAGLVIDSQEICEGCPFAIAQSHSGDLNLKEFDFDFLEGFSLYPREAIILENGNILISGAFGSKSYETVTVSVPYPDEFVNVKIDLSCPAIVEYSTNGEMVRYLTCDSFEYEDQVSYTISGLREASDGKILFSGTSYGPDISFAGQVIRGGNTGTLWIGELDDNLSMIWSGTPFDGHVSRIIESADAEIVMVGDLREDANFGRNSQVSIDGSHFLILIIGDFDDIDQDGILSEDDLCEASEMGWESNASTDNDGDGCKDSTEDEDDDNDGCLDIIDDFPVDIAECFDTDFDGIGNNEDMDDDGDRVSDDADKFPLDAAAWNDTDLDGMPDQMNSSIESPLVEDLDDDGDGVNDTEDSFPLNPDEWSDLDSDGTGDNSDECIGTYGTSTVDRIGCLDQDGDGVSDLNDIEPYNADVGLNEYDGPRKDLSEDPQGETNNVSKDSDQTSNNINSLGISIGGILFIVVIVLFIRRFKVEGDDDDDEDYVNEEFHSVGHSEEEQGEAGVPTLSFDITGETHESGYEVIEHPMGSDKWWWKDEENECWVAWD